MSSYQIRDRVEIIRETREIGGLESRENMGVGEIGGLESRENMGVGESVGGIEGEQVTFQTQRSRLRNNMTILLIVSSYIHSNNCHVKLRNFKFVGI